MKYWMKKIKVALCMLLIFTMTVPCGITQAATAKNMGVTGEDVQNAASQPTITYQMVADQLGKYFIDNAATNSIQIAIMDHGKITFSNTYGYNSKKKNTALTEDTMYGIGSVSKIYTAAAVMHLVDQRKVELDKPVVDYVKDFKMKDSRYKKITVRMLLNHSSGLMGSYMSNSITLNESNTLHHDQFLNVLADQYLQYEPGTLSVYNNDGFELAEVLVERVSKKTFTKYLEQEIFKPLGLNNTKTPESKFNRSNLAAIYNPLVPGDEFEYESVNTIGAGGIYSTAEDMCQFGTIFMNDSLNPLLSVNSRKAMANKEYARGFWLSRETDSFAYGLGWDSVHYAGLADFGIAALQKGGDTACYHCSMTVLPEKDITITVISSGGSSSNDAIFSNNVILQYLADQGKLGTRIQKETEVNYERADLPAYIDELCGSYINSCSPVIEVRKKDNTIIVPYGGADHTFHYTKQGMFVSDEPGLTMKFITHNGIPYIEWYQIYDLGNLGKLDFSMVLAQKMVNNPISQKVKKVWEKRFDKEYFLADALPSVADYLNGADSMILKLPKDYIDNGYIYNMQIIDQNLCMSQASVPVMNGRNGSIIKFYQKNGLEYCTCNGSTYVSSDCVKKFPDKESFKVTIPKSGFSQYYMINSNMSQKNITIKVPKKCSFLVLDENGQTLNNYYLDRDNTIKLPKEGLLCFVGNKNATFTITNK